MQVHNVHERTYAASPPELGAVIDSLASGEDRLWPSDRWPRIRFDRPLGPDAAGGHGPVRYIVEKYERGRGIVFRFTGPRGFDGTHGFQMEAAPGGVRLTHTLTMRARGPARITWPLVFRPLHDALVEDALDRAAVSLGLEPERKRWSPWVRGLRRILDRR